MISKAVIPFIEKYKKLIEEENFSTLYIKAEDEGLTLAALTEAFLGADVDPMIYFQDIIPDTYAARLPLVSIDIPEGILSIHSSAFQACSNLTSVHLPNSLISIGVKTFSNCSRLTNINLPDSISEIGIGAFEFCYHLKNVNLPKHITRIELETFSGCEGLESITIGDKLVIILPQAFSHCSKLSSMTFPDSLEVISPEAFSDCDDLRELTFLGTVPPRIERNAFSNCPIETIHFNGSMTTWKNNVGMEGFNLSNQIKVVCSDGEIVKNKGDLSWKMSGED